MHNKYDFGTEGGISMCIYKIQNNSTNLIYIGKTTVEVSKRWSAHLSSAKRSKTHIGRALHKYGKDAFTFEVIDIAENEQSLSVKESFYISYYGSLTPNGYNLTTGGEGAALSEETKEKLSFSHAKLHGRERSNRMEHKIIKDRFPALYEEMARINRSQSQIGKPSSRKGQKASPDTVEKMRDAHKGRENYYRRVVTRNDGIVFNSLDEAAKVSGTNKPNIVAQIKGTKRICNGFQFKYGETDSWEIPEKGVNPKAKSVVRNDGIIFESVTLAAKESGVHQANITKVLLGKRKTTGGYSFKYYEEKEQ